MTYSNKYLITNLSKKLIEILKYKFNCRVIYYFLYLSLAMIS